MRKRKHVTIQTGTNGVAVFKRLTYHTFSLGMPRFPRFFITTHVYSYNYIYIYILYIFINSQLFVYNSYICYGLSPHI